MRCPICKSPVVYEGNQFRPFCSARCKVIDLGNWLSGRYRVSTPVEEWEETQGVDANEPTVKGKRG